MRRCLNDYAGSDSALSLAGYWWQPPPLLFRGKHRLSVTRAPDPSQVIWEHLELTTCNRLLRQTAVNFLLLSLLFISLFLIILAQAEEARFRSEVPQLATCNTALPAIAFKQPIYSDGLLAPGSQIPSGISLLWDRNDPVCPAGTQRIHWSVSGSGPFTSRGNSDPCLNECINTANPKTCVWPAYGGGNFTISTAVSVACYCFASLTDEITTKGLFTGATALSDTTGSLCNEVANNYITLNAVRFLLPYL